MALSFWPWLGFGVCDALWPGRRCSPAETKDPRAEDDVVSAAVELRWLPHETREKQRDAEDGERRWRPSQPLWREGEKGFCLPSQPWDPLHGHGGDWLEDST